MYSRMVVGGKRKCLSGAPKSLKLYVFSAYAFRGFDYAVSIMDVEHLTDSHQPDVLILTETNHATHKSRWRLALPQYLLKCSRPYFSLVPLPNAGVLFAVRRASFQSATVLTPPPHLIPHIAGLTLIGAYMPQLHTPQLNRLYAEVAAWGLRMAHAHPHHCALWGGDFQSTTTTGTSHHAFTSLLESHLQPHPYLLPQRRLP